MNVRLKLTAVSAFVIAVAIVLAACGQKSSAIPSAPATRPSLGHRTATGRVLHTFLGGSDGASPVGATVFYNGLVYGVTSAGGATNPSCVDGCGTVYSVDPQTGEEHVVYAFEGGTDGDSPLAGLIEYGGVLYGTTFEGGSTTGCDGHGCGTVFGVTPSGQEVFTYRFPGGVAGSGPLSIVESGGTLYGLTDAGGGSSVCANYYLYGCGTVFSLTPTGDERTIYAFTGLNYDSAGPGGPLYLSHGVLYGFTFAAASLNGAIFSVTLSGKESVLYHFLGGTAGAFPTSLVKWNGELFGTTSFGGGKGCKEYGNTAGCGFAFAIRRDGTFDVLHAFRGNWRDGGNPDGLVKHGTAFYGVAGVGGASACRCGTLFKIDVRGGYSTLYSLPGGAGGDYPDAPPLFVSPSAAVVTTTYEGDPACKCGAVNIVDL